LLAAQPARPNVIVILTDDQGTVDLRAAGAMDLETPHLDALARRGVRFTQSNSVTPHQRRPTSRPHDLTSSLASNGCGPSGRPVFPKSETRNPKPEIQIQGSGSKQQP